MRSDMTRPLAALLLAGVLLVPACAEPGTNVDLGAGSATPPVSEDGGDVESQPEVVPACEDLEGKPYSPPAEEQPPADPAITTAQPRGDIEPLPPDEPQEEGKPRIAGEAPPTALTQAQQWAQQEAPEHFAGLWLDNDEGAAVIAFTDDVDSYAQQVREQFGAGWWVVKADHSMAELQALQRRVSKEMAEDWNPDGEPGPGTMYATGIDPRISRVTMTIIEPDEQRVAELAERYGTDLICLEIESMPGEEEARPAPWEPAPGADLSPGSTSIDVLVNEVNCASGQPAHGRIPAPDIVYREDSIVITIGVVPRAGGQTCPSNPNTPFTVELDEPLGDRVLLDGSQEPPAEPDLDRAPTE